MDGTHTLPPVVYSAVRSYEGKHSGHVMAVVCISKRCQDPGRGVIKMGRRRTEFVEASEGLGALVKVERLHMRDVLTVVEIDHEKREFHHDAVGRRALY